MKTLPLILTFVVLILSCKESPAQDKKVVHPDPMGQYENIDVATFRKKMNAENVIVLDVRTPEETAESKISGAIEIDIKNPKFDDEIDALDKEVTYLVYCRSGRRSRTACKTMADKGFKSLYNLDGGIIAWKAAQ